MRDFLNHLFLPVHSNNHRAKFLHHKSIFFLIIFFLIAQFGLSAIRENHSRVLGVFTNISSQQILLLTNQERQKNNISPLIINDQLSDAAMLKAKDMFGKNYWAHNAPDGTTPWFFIKQAGYEYTFAGENLARGFTDSQEVVKAWMESPTHRENMLSSNFKEVGFAILEGKLLEDETSLVVEMFGNKSSISLEKGMQQNIQKSVNSAVLYQPKETVVNTRPFIDSKALSLNLSSFLLLLFILVLLLDMIIVERKRIQRMVGHNFDHILFLGLIFIVIIILGKGIIL